MRRFLFTQADSWRSRFRSTRGIACQRRPERRRLRPRGGGRECGISAGRVSVGSPPAHLSTSATDSASAGSPPPSFRASMRAGTTMRHGHRARRYLSSYRLGLPTTAVSSRGDIIRYPATCVTSTTRATDHVTLSFVAVVATALRRDAIHIDTTCFELQREVSIPSLRYSASRSPRCPCE